MGDQVDSKSVFGSYHCTEVAGQFQWKQSNLTQWLAEPSLILLEDIDMANSDVISIFKEIAKSRRIQLPSGESIPFHEKARLLSTSSGKGKKNTILEKVCRVNLEALSDKELGRLVLQVRRVFYFLKHFIVLSAVFGSSQNAHQHISNYRSRAGQWKQQILDLERLPSSLCSPQSSDRSFWADEPLHRASWCLGAVWTVRTISSSLRKGETASDRTNFLILLQIAARLSVTPDQIASHLKMRQPSFTHDDYHCTIGRCTLPRAPSLKFVQHHRLGHTR